MYDPAQKYLIVQLLVCRFNEQLATAYHKRF